MHGVVALLGNASWQDTSLLQKACQSSSSQLLWFQRCNNYANLEIGQSGPFLEIWLQLYTGDKNTLLLFQLARRMLRALIDLYENGYTTYKGLIDKTKLDLTTDLDVAEKSVSCELTQNLCGYTIRTPQCTPQL